MLLTGKTQPEVDAERQAAEAERKVADATRELERIDRESIRAIRAQSLGAEMKADRDRLAELETQAAKQREIIRENKRT